MRDRCGNVIEPGQRIVFPTSMLGPFGDGVVTRVSPSIMPPQGGNGRPQGPSETIEITVTIRLDVPVGSQIREMAVAKQPPEITQ